MGEVDNSCKKELSACGSCTRPYKVKLDEWCYDTRFDLPRLIEATETFKIENKTQHVVQKSNSDLDTEDESHRVSYGLSNDTVPESDGPSALL